MPGTLTVHYGLRSPYAWLAQRLLQATLPPAALDGIEWVPYWDPAPATLAALQAAGGDFLYRPMSRARHLYILGDIKRLAAQLGCPLRWPVDDASPAWEAPHRACLAAAAAGSAAVLRQALFQARWEQGLDICRPGVLASLCAPLGVNGEAAALATPALDQAALDALLRAYRLGVFGLPTFVCGRERWWGVDRLHLALRAAGLPWQGVAAAWAGLAPLPARLLEEASA